MDAIASVITGNVYNPDTDIPDLSGKASLHIRPLPNFVHDFLTRFPQVYVVTGGTAGIGFGIVAHLVQHNAAKVIILSNKKEHADSAIEQLKEFTPSGKSADSIVSWEHCDLTSFKTTDRVAKSLAKSLTQLDALILNAGLGVGKFSLTEDGLDSHMQVNHFSQMHLALTLLPALQKTPHSRLVAQSSDMHSLPPSDVAYASIDEFKNDIGPTYLYGRTKLANILFIRALHRRSIKGELGFSKGKPSVYINATHPGAVSTDQPKQAEEAYGILGTIGVALVRPLMKDPVSQGCRTILFAATSEDVVNDGINGEYIVPDRKIETPSEKGRDDEMGERLWKVSLEILEQKLGKLDYGYELS